MSPGRATADDRLRRLLALVPWVAANDGPTVDDVCARFGCTPAELTADLDLLFMVGVYPFSPDTLIEVDVSDGRVWISYADWFARPLRMTPAEGLTLVAAGAALLAAPGSDPEGPLARGLAKLASVLGIDPEDAVDIELGDAPPELLSTLQEASAAGHRVRLDYYSFGRDAWATRTIDPWRVFSSAGQWYVSAHCHEAAAARLFRIDRMRDVEILDETFEPPPAAPPPATYTQRDDDPLVVLELEPQARWVVEQYPLESVEHLPDGRLRISLRVSETAWLERLLLRLGATATLLSGADEVRRHAAARVLARYRGDGSGGSSDTVATT